MARLKPSKSIQSVLKAAGEARSNAYAPYSKFKVGAALKLSGVPKPVAGCNVENASFGATICAERGAILQAVARYGKIKPELLVIVTDQKDPAPPCGLCLQMLAEFADDSLPVMLATPDGDVREHQLKDFLPHPFRQFRGTK